MVSFNYREVKIVFLMFDDEIAKKFNINQYYDFLIILNTHQHGFSKLKKLIQCKTSVEKKLELDLKCEFVRENQDSLVYHIVNLFTLVINKN